MFRWLFVTALALAASWPVAPAEARRDRIRQVVIAKETLDPSATSAGIDVSKAKGAFKAIRIRATKGPIEFTGLRFVYNDDSFHTVEKTFTLRPGERTKLLDERDSDRFIDKVFVNYKSTGNPMVVEITGLQSRAGSGMERTQAPAAVAAPAGETAPQPAAATPPAAVAPAVTAVTAAIPAPPAPKPKPVIADPKSIREGRDVMFGYQSVSAGSEKEKLRVVSEVGKFHAVRLHVFESDVHVSEIEIVFADGSSQVLAIDSAIRAGQYSKWYSVNGAALIKDVSLALRPKKNAKGAARIEIVGQYADGWLGADGEGRKFNNGWVLLGSETAGSIGFDKDVISVGENKGDFSKLLLQVRDRSITLREIRVVYQDGKDQVIRTNDRVDPDQKAGPWDLERGSAAVKEIVAVYRRRLLIGRGQGSPVVEIWGQH